MSLNAFPGEKLTNEDREFVELCADGDGAYGAIAEAYREVFLNQGLDPMAHVSGSAANDSEKGRDHLRRPKLRAYYEYLKLGPIEQALVNQRQALRSTDPTLRLQTSREILARDAKKDMRSVRDRWLELMREVGLEIVVPVAPGDTEVRVSLSDCFDPKGRAYVELPLEGKLRLLKLAGAPWNEGDPDAELSDLQKELLARPERTKVIHGGSGVGKSVLGGCESLVEVVLPLRRSALVGDTYDTCSSEFGYVYEGWARLFGKESAMRCMNVNRHSQHDMEIITYWDSISKTYSTDRDYGASMLGKEFDHIGICEGSHVAADIHDRKIKRAADRRLKKAKSGHQRKTGRITIYTTPDGFDGCSSAICDRVDAKTKRQPRKLHVGQAPWAETVYIREANCLENPSYSREAFESARKDLPHDIFAEQYEGRRVRRSGLIYPEYDPRKHVLPMPKPDLIRTMRLSVGIDTGKFFSALLIGMLPDRTTWVLCEVYTESLRTEESCKQFTEKVVGCLAPAYACRTWADIVGKIDMYRIDPRSQVKQEAFKALDAPLAFDDLGVQDSIDRVRTAFHQDKLYIAKEHTCDTLENAGIRWELERYRWRVVKSSEGSRVELEPAKKNDHACDALRMGYWPLEEAGPFEQHQEVQTDLTEAFHRGQLEAIYGNRQRQLREANVHPIRR